MKARSTESRDLSMNWDGKRVCRTRRVGTMDRAQETVSELTNRLQETYNNSSIRRNTEIQDKRDGEIKRLENSTGILNLGTQGT